MADQHGIKARIGELTRTVEVGSTHVTTLNMRIRAVHVRYRRASKDGHTASMEKMKVEVKALEEKRDVYYAYICSVCDELSRQRALLARVARNNRRYGLTEDDDRDVHLASVGPPRRVWESPTERVGGPHAAMTLHTVN